MDSVAIKATQEAGGRKRDPTNLRVEKGSFSAGEGARVKSTKRATVT